ncbi:MAG TPA: MoxR family ATPase [Kofleriaceae bacterium]|jgi:MoxR-like ATPase
MDLATVRDVAARLREQVQRVVVGQDHAIDLLLVSLLSEGHVLFEGVPGVAKTLLARTFAASLSLQFGRVQFTPDLMPGDIVGTNLFNFQTNKFTLTKGPIFTELLLADEINRTPPKTQAALLQAMQERVITIDTETYELGDGFMVIATQNPIEQEGTYPLPEAQLDRFLFKIVVGYPSRDEERAIVHRHGHRTTMPRLGDFDLRPVADLGTIAAMRAAIGEIRVSDAIIDYIVDLVRATRERPSISYGASPRAATMLTTSARAFAAMAGRDFVLPDDIKALAVPALRHRIVLAPGAEIEGLTTEQVVRQIVEQVPAPR